jgi:hypothetical protein
VDGGGDVLEPVVHEPRTVHRLDHAPHGPTPHGRARRQPRQPVGIRRRRPLVDDLAGTVNADDVTAELCVLQARALAGLNMDDAAIAACKEALRSKKRQPGILRDARFTRGVLYQRRGKISQARKDFEQVYASDPSFRDVRDRLAGLTS